MNDLMVSNGLPTKNEFWAVGIEHKRAKGLSSKSNYISNILAYLKKMRNMKVCRGSLLAKNKQITGLSK